MPSREVKTVMLVLLLYTVLSIVLTYPLIIHMSDSVPGSYDVWYFVWSNWWVKKSILELRTNPLETDYILHPSGVDLSLTDSALLNSLFSIPFSNPVFALNLVSLLSFILSALGMYLLAKYLTGDAKASFLAGIIFSFAPYHLLELQLGHINLVSMQWIPFYVLYLLKALNEDGGKNKIITAFFLALISLSSWQYTLYAFFFTLLYVSYSWMQNKIQIKKSLKSVSLILLYSSIILSPVIIQMLKSYLSQTFVSRRSFDMMVFYSSELTNLLQPNILHPLYGDRVLELISNIHPLYYTGALTIGFTVSYLVLIHLSRQESLSSWIQSKRNSIKFNKKILILLPILFIVHMALLYPVFKLNILKISIFIIFETSIILLYYLIKDRVLSVWTFCAISTLILSMGPLIKFMGEPYFPGPYILLLLMPILRIPFRSIVFFNLCIAVLAGKGLSELNKRHSRQILVTSILTLFILFEFLSIPLQMTSTNVPEFYNEISSDGMDYKILDLPLAPALIYTNNSIVTHDMPKYFFYQTIHEKKLITAPLSVIPEKVLRSYNSNPVLSQFNNIWDNDDPVLPENASSILRDIGVKYVIVHEYELSYQESLKPGTSLKLNKTLEPLILDNRIAYHDSEILVIEITA